MKVKLHRDPQGLSYSLHLLQDDGTDGDCLVTVDSDWDYPILAAEFGCVSHTGKLDTAAISEAMDFLDARQGDVINLNDEGVMLWKEYRK